MMFVSLWAGFQACPALDTPPVQLLALLCSPLRTISELCQLAREYESAHCMGGCISKDNQPCFRNEGNLWTGCASSPSQHALGHSSASFDGSQVQTLLLRLFVELAAPLYRGPLANATQHDTFQAISYMCTAVSVPNHQTNILSRI